MAVPVDLPTGAGSIFTGDLATLQGHADTLGVSVGMLTRHAIRLGMAALTEDIDVDSDTFADLEAAA